MAEASPEYTVDEALSSMGFGKFQALVFAYGGLGWLAEAMEVMILSFIGPAVKNEWALSSTEESLITTVVFAGMLLGAYSWGLVSDSYGRRKGLLSVAVMNSGAGLASAFAPNYTALVILRCLVGFGLGGGPVYSSWFIEFVPAPRRGFWMVVFSVSWTVGTIFEASLAWIVMPRLNWRWLVGLSSTPCFLALAFWCLTPESPRYLCAKGRIDDARKILESVARMNKKVLPSGKLVTDQNVTVDEEVASTPYLHTLCGPKTVTKIITAVFSSLVVLLSRKLVRTTVGVWLLFFGNAFSYYGIILLTSQLSSGGDSKCHSNSRDSKHVLGTNLYLNVFITSFAEFPGLVLSAVLVDRVGRKLSMGIMFAICCVFLFPLVFRQNEIAMTTLLFGARMCVLGTFTVVSIYAPEVYPTTIRSTGYGVASAVGRIGGMVCPLVAVGLVSGCHQRTAILLFEAVLIIAGLSILLLPVETKGRVLIDSVDHATD